MTAAEGLTVTQRRYVSAADAHYGGNLVDGAYVLALFGDVATEACIRMDGDEGLFASYSDVQFRAPVLAGDIIEATATALQHTGVQRPSQELCNAGSGEGLSPVWVMKRLCLNLPYVSYHQQRTCRWIRLRRLSARVPEET